MGVDEGPHRRVIADQFKTHRQPRRRELVRVDGYAVRVRQIARLVLGHGRERDTGPQRRAGQVDGEGWSEQALEERPARAPGMIREIDAKQGERISQMIVLKDYANQLKSTAASEKFVALMLDGDRNNINAKIEQVLEWADKNTEASKED